MMRLLRLRLRSTGQYRVVVHFDTTKLDASGQPDERYIFRLTLPPKPGGVTHAAYLQQERPWIRALCQAALAKLEATEGSALPGEGDEL